MRIRRGFINWGIFLVCLGTVPLAVELGGLDRETAASLLRLWPLILVGIGLGLLLRFTQLEVLGGIIVAGTFGLLSGVLFAGGFPSASVACGAGDATVPPRQSSGTVAGGLRLNVELTCGEIGVDRSPGTAWSVDVRAGSGEPTIEATDGLLRLRSATRDGILFASDHRELWEVTLPTELDTVYVTLNASSGTFDLGAGPILLFSGDLNASDLDLDLAEADLSHGPLNLTLNASSATVSLPSAGTGAESSVTLNASSLTLCASPSLGLRITYDDTLSSNNFAAAGLAQSGKTWQSANYASAVGHADLHVSANLSSVTLNPSGGCQ